MEAKRQPAPLVVIVGTTASGKSKLAMELARKFNGEIICADSRTIYKGMDIGTAKPSAAEQAEIKHHLLDVITPDQSFSAADFKKLALKAIDDISSRGKLPIMVGGTGLYIDGVIFDFAFLPPAPSEERELLQNLSIEELQQKLKEQGITPPKNSSNPRHLIRTLETNGAVAVKKGLRKNTLIIGLETSRDVLLQNVTTRIVAMLHEGLEAEVSHLVYTYSWQAPGLTAVGYREWQGNDRSQAAELVVKSTMQYAKRQRTWFKRNSHIKWVQNSADASAYVKDFLQEIS